MLNHLLQPLDCAWRRVEEDERILTALCMHAAKQCARHEHAALHRTATSTRATEVTNRSSIALTEPQRMRKLESRHMTAWMRSGSASSAPAAARAKARCVCSRHYPAQSRGRSTCAHSRCQLHITRSGCQGASRRDQRAGIFGLANCEERASGVATHQKSAHILRR